MHTPRRHVILGIFCAQNFNETPGAIVPIETSFVSSEWAFVCANVGDCKVFMWNEEEGVRDITFGNRTNALDSRDSGGRIGPYADGANADLRNFQTYFCPCKPGMKNFNPSENKW